MDCTTDTTFTHNDIVLSTGNNTDSFAPAFRYAEDVTPLEHGVKSRCEDTTSTIAEGVKKQVYRIGVDLGQAFPNDCQINFSWQDQQVIPYKSGVNEAAYMEGWINYCQFQEGHSPKYQHDPPFITKRDVIITHDPWLKDLDGDSVTIVGGRLSTSTDHSSYYNNGCGYYFPCCVGCCDIPDNSFFMDSYTGAFELLFQCSEDYFYLENNILEYRNGQQIAKMPYEMALQMKDMPGTDHPVLKDKGPFYACVGDTLDLDIKYDPWTQYDSIYITNWKFFDSTATMDTQPNQPVKGQFQWAPESGDYREDAYQLKVRAVNENNYKLAKTQTILIKVKKDTGVHVHQIEQGRVCDSLYVMADSVTGPGSYNYNWLINEKSVNADSVLHYTFDSNGTYHLKLAVHSRPACDSFHYSDTIQVKNLVDAKIKGPDTVCPGSKTTLSVGASSGADSFSYAWNNGLAGDTIQPVIKSDSLLDVKVVNQDGCVAHDTFIVNIHPHQPVTCRPPEKAYCWNGPVDTLNICDKTVSWQGTGIKQDSIFDTKAAYSGQSDTFALTASYQDSFGCVANDTFKAIVKGKPEVGFQPDTVCRDGSVVKLPDSTQNGALRWSGKGVQDSVFDPQNVSAGKHWAVFTHTGAQGCQFKDSFAIRVYAKPVIDTQLTACTNQSAVPLPDFPGPQNWQGPGITNDTLNPDSLAPGLYHATFDYSNPSTTCQLTDSIPVKINELPKVDAGKDLTVCHQDTLIALQGQPKGGHWSGASIAQDSLNPLSLDPGTHTLVYTYTDSLGCSNSDSLEVTVNPLPDVSFDLQPQIGEAPMKVNLTYIGRDSLISHRWFIFIGPNADTLHGADTTYTFTDTGQHVILFQGTNAYGCSVVEDKLVQVSENVVVAPATSNDEHITIYPNPTRANFTIEATTDFRKVVIRDLKGAIVKTLEGLNASRIRVKTDNLSEGYYQVDVQLGNGTTGSLPLVIE